jgi:hypothetical protein
MSVVESWRELPGGEIEFTMRRLRSAGWRFYDKTRRVDTAAGLSFYACEHRVVAKTNGTVNDYGKRQVNGASNARRCSDKKPCHRRGQVWEETQAWRRPADTGGE